MNQEKIGKFIAEKRKLKKLTQAEFAEQLGVSDRTVGNWERGRNMPDLSLFKSICDILDISINEFLSGENIKEEKYQEKLEENIINTIDYSNKKVTEKNKIISMILMIFGILITITAMTIFPSESSWGSIYAVIGLLISLVGFSKLIKKLNYIRRLIVDIGYFVLYMAFLLFIDFIGVVNMKQAPRFSYAEESYGDMIVYKTLFYNVYRMNVDDTNEYYVVDISHKYTKDNIPKTPFNRNKSGIDSLVKYKSNDLNDNVNILNLVDHLPLSEYVHEVAIDKEHKKLNIKYIIDDIKIKNNFYLEKSLVYNSISILGLIDSLETINFTFSHNNYCIELIDINSDNMNYTVDRKTIEDNFKEFNVLIGKKINKSVFNEYVEKQMNEDGYVNYLFNVFFIKPSLDKTIKIEVKNNMDEFIKNIIDKDKIESIVFSITTASRLPEDAAINLISNTWNIVMYDEKDNILGKYMIWRNGLIVDSINRYYTLDHQSQDDLNILFSN